MDAISTVSTSVKKLLNYITLFGKYIIVYYLYIASSSSGLAPLSHKQKAVRYGGSNPSLATD